MPGNISSSFTFVFKIYKANKLFIQIFSLSPSQSWTKSLLEWHGHFRLEEVCLPSHQPKCVNFEKNTPTPMLTRMHHSCRSSSSIAFIQASIVDTHRKVKKTSTPSPTYKAQNENVKLIKYCAFKGFSRLILEKEVDSDTPKISMGANMSFTNKC